MLKTVDTNGRKDFSWQRDWRVRRKAQEACDSSQPLSSKCFTSAASPVAEAAGSRKAENSCLQLQAQERTGSIDSEGILVFIVFSDFGLAEGHRAQCTIASNGNMYVVCSVSASATLETFCVGSVHCQ